MQDIEKLKDLGKTGPYKQYLFLSNILKPHQNITATKPYDWHKLFCWGACLLYNYKKDVSDSNIHRKMCPRKMPKKMAEPNHIHSSKKTSKKYTALKADI